MNGIAFSINNGEYEYVGVDDGAVILNVDTSDMSISGYDNHDFGYLKWEGRELGLDDTLIISFQEAETVLPPIAVRYETIDELYEKYTQLKEEYTKLGWL